MPLNCSGKELPDIPSVECADTVIDIEDCSRLVEIEDEVLLHESVEHGYHYWTIIQAGDETPFAVCHLEKYADSKNMEGRKSDYLLCGWQKGECIIVVCELRQTLLNERQIKDKIDQVVQTLNLIDNQLITEIQASDIFSQSCTQPDEYKLLGIVIPSSRSKKRAEQTGIVTINGRKVAIVALPGSKIKNCRISWTEMMAAAGLNP